jgi:hypothetical protein
LRPRRDRGTTFLIGLVLWAGAIGPACADAQLTQSEERQFNVAFATEIGSGIYTVSGRTLQVYRLPLAYTFRKGEEGEESRRGWRFNFPVTFGFYSLDPQDIADTGLRENIATISLVPGVEFLLPVARNWLLKPYAEAGHVWEREGAADAWVYAGGIRSRADFAAGRFDLVLGNGLTYALVDPAGDAGQDSLCVLETAFAAHHPLGREGRAARSDYAMYFVQHLYFREPGQPLDTGTGDRVVDEYEIGVTFGPRDPVRLWRIPVPRIGVGFLFGQELSAFRLVFGTPAASLKK